MWYLVLYAASYVYDKSCLGRPPPSTLRQTMTQHPWEAPRNFSVCFLLKPSPRWQDIWVSRDQADGINFLFLFPKICMYIGDYFCRRQVKLQTDTVLHYSIHWVWVFGAISSLLTATLGGIHLNHLTPSPFSPFFSCFFNWHVTLHLFPEIQPNDLIFAYIVKL